MRAAIPVFARCESGDPGLGNFFFQFTPLSYRSRGTFFGCGYRNAWSEESNRRMAVNKKFIPGKGGGGEVGKRLYVQTPDFASEGVFVKG